jgi:trehalose synthase
LGVLQAFQEAKKRVPALQLVLAGSSADDDPDGARILAEVRDAADAIPDVHILADRADDLEVNALQTVSTVVLQKSLREGFGLTVSEALWSGTPVIGGRVGGIGGIPTQVMDGQSGYLVDSAPEAAARIVELARDSAKARAMGAVGHADVRRRFLLPRMIRDDLRLWADLLGA